jgi:uncharacterized membrane protein
MEDFLNFKKMITPMIIKILFWVLVAVCVIGGLISIAGGATSNYGGGAAVLTGLLMLVLGPVAARIYCELLIVIFSINQNVREINERAKGELPK